MDFPLFTKRALCILLALIFCTCCVIQPIQADALVLDSAAVVGVALTVAVSYILIACGIHVNQEYPNAFNALVTSISESLSSTFTYVNAAGSVLVKMLRLEGGFMYAPQDLVAEVLRMAHASGLLSRVYKDTVPSTSPAFFSTFLEAVTVRFGFDYPYYLILETPTDYYQYTVYLMSSAYYWNLWLDEGSLSYLYCNYKLTYTASGQLYGHTYYPNKDKVYAPFNAASSYLWGEFQTMPYSDELMLGNLGEDLEDEKYKTWVQDPIISIDWGIQLEPDPEDPTSPSDPQRTDTPYLPITIPENPSEFPDSTQEEVQSGQPSTYVPEDTGENVELDPDSVPDDVLDYIISTDSGSDSGGSGSDTGTGSPTSGTISSSETVDPNEFRVDLTKFFPFCIPFDLYKMLACLAAEPVAPEFTFAVPLPGGDIYEFDIELSAWDDVAATVRMFEVAIFCIGLTVATRKFIKW